MKVLADTSVLVAALVAGHPRHERAFPWLARARRGEAKLVIAAHSLAELYSVLTTLPLRPKITPLAARQLIQQSVEALAEIVDVTPPDYARVLDEAAELSLTGGIIYDALIAAAARKARVDRLLTFNVDDFRRVWPDAGQRIREP